MHTRSVDAYMQLPYRMAIYQDEECWVAEFPDLPGLVAAHETREGLQEAIRDAKETYFEAMLETGRAIPLPHERHT